MMNTPLRSICLAAGATLALAASAQTISGIKVEPAAAKAGEPVNITATFDNADSPNCNVRLYFGDGKTQDFKINQTKDVPLVTSYTYAQAGTYALMVEGKTALPMLKCTGANKRVSLKVAAADPPPAPAAPAPTAAAAPAAAKADGCPAGWKLDAKSMNKKTGAFTCKGKAGSALPTAKLDCPAALGYFENKSKGQLGCRP
jgi:PKD domain